MPKAFVASEEWIYGHDLDGKERKVKYRYVRGR